MTTAEEAAPIEGKLRINMTLRRDVDPELYALLERLPYGGMPKAALAMMRAALAKGGAGSPDPVALPAGETITALTREINRLTALVDRLSGQPFAMAPTSGVGTPAPVPPPEEPATVAPDPDVAAISPEQRAAIHRMASAFGTAS